MDVRPYRHEDRGAALAFARRISQALPEESFWIPERCHDDYRSAPRSVEKIVVVDEEGIHGGLNLRHDLFFIDDRRVWLGYYRYPVSEGIIDRRYAFVGLQLQQAVCQRVGYVYGMGAGGLRSTAMQVLLRSGWSGSEVPFYCYLNHPARCFSQLPALKHTALRRAAARAATWSGLGWLALKSVQRARAARARRALRSVRFKVVSEFDDWADDLFSRCRSHYRIVASRERQVLPSFHLDGTNLQRVVVSVDQKRIGWFVTVTPLHGKQNHFGELSVGLIADFFAHPRHAREVIAAATEFLKQQHVDLLVCNASHAAWKAAIASSGYWEGPSNFPFVGSPQLIETISPFPASLESAHLTRCDGDGLDAFLSPASPQQLAA